MRMFGHGKANKDRRPPRARTEAPPYVLPILLILVTIAFFALIVGFYKAIVWAFVFALLSNSLYDYLTGKLGGREMLAAGIATLVVVLLVLLPAVGFSVVLASQASEVVQSIQDGDIDAAGPIQWVLQVPSRLQALAQSAGVNVGDLSTRFSDTISKGGEMLASTALLVGQGALRAGLLLALTAYLLFFFLYDGRRILNFIEEAFPIRGPGEHYLMQEICDVTQATVKGIIIIGIAQGTIGGIAFLLLGVPNALLWGCAIAVSTILPVVGTAIVWGPVALWFFSDGEWLKGVLMLIIGVGLIGLVDNLLRPRVVGRDTRMPDYIVLLSTLGGLGAFGLTGLVLGPVIAGAFLASWRMYRPEVSLDLKEEEDAA